MVGAHKLEKVTSKNVKLWINHVAMIFLSHSRLIEIFPLTD